MTSDAAEHEHIDLDTISERWVQRASFVMSCTRWHGSMRPGVRPPPGSVSTEQMILAEDAATGECVRLPLALGEGRDGLEFLSLAPDGGAVVMQDRTHRFGGWLRVVDISNGEPRSFELGNVHKVGTSAALSRDGSTLAVVCAGPDPDPGVDPDVNGLGVVMLVDVATGATKNLFTAPGGSAGGNHVAWSPDGQRVAATYIALDEEHPEGDAQTIVLGLDGRVAFSAPDQNVGLWAGRNSWVDEHTLLCFRYDGTVRIDVRTGASEPLPLKWGEVARFADRAVFEAGRTMEDGLSQPTVLLSRLISGDDERPWRTISPFVSNVRVDFA